MKKEEIEPITEHTVSSIIRFYKYKGSISDEIKLNKKAVENYFNNINYNKNRDMKKEEISAETANKLTEAFYKSCDSIDNFVSSVHEAMKMQIVNYSIAIANSILKYETKKQNSWLFKWYYDIKLTRLYKILKGLSEIDL